MVVALAITLDQHFPDFLADFEQNLARVCDLKYAGTDGTPRMGDSPTLCAASSMSSCPQMRSTVQPLALSASFVSRSR